MNEHFEQVLAMLVRKGFDSTVDQLRAHSIAQHGALFWHGSPQAWKGKPVQLYLAPPTAAHGKPALGPNGSADRYFYERGFEAGKRAAEHGDEAVAEVYRKGFDRGSLVWTNAGSKMDLADGTKLYTMRAQAGEGCV